MVLRVLDKMGNEYRAREMLYNAVVQTVLLYGSESWVITEAIMKVLEAFHQRIVRRIMDKTYWRVGW